MKQAKRRALRATLLLACLCGYQALHYQPVCINHLLQMIVAGLITPEDHCLPYRTHNVDHLTADRACLTGGEVAVVALLEIDADFP